MAILKLVSGLMIASFILLTIAYFAVLLDQRNIGPALALNLLALACSLLAIAVLIIDWVISW